MLPFKIILIFINILIIVSCCNTNLRSLRSAVGAKFKKKIRFDQFGKLKIVQFADLHYGEAPSKEGPLNDIKSSQVIRDILHWEDPHFVIFTGDQITGDFMGYNATDYVHLYLEPLVEGGFKWASVYGNHDLGTNLQKEDVLAAEQSYFDLCYTKKMAPEGVPGVTNYYLPIYPPQKLLSKVVEDKPVMIWWFLDSQGGAFGEERMPFYIDGKVIKWFKREAKKIKEKWGDLPSLVFFHIPPQEFVSAGDSVRINQMCSGMSEQRVKPQEKNTGIMRALFEVGGVKTIFVGHNHGNAWCCYYEDMEVCFNRRSGYGGYGDWTKGSRVIVLDYNNLSNQKNYVRLETGEIVDRFPAKY